MRLVQALVSFDQTVRLLAWVLFALIPTRLLGAARSNRVKDTVHFVSPVFEPCPLHIRAYDKSRRDQRSVVRQEWQVQVCVTSALLKAYVHN